MSSSKQVKRDKEAMAISSRQEAQDYLDIHGVGPSMKERFGENSSLVKKQDEEGDNTLSVMSSHTHNDNDNIHNTNIHVEHVTQKRTTPLGGYSSDSDLPTGWKRARAPDNTRRIYYYHLKTDETTWEDPRKPSDLPLGWKGVPDGDEEYYWNIHSNEVTWDKPEHAAISIEQAQAARAKLDAVLARVDTGSSSK